MHKTVPIFESRKIDKKEKKKKELGTVKKKDNKILVVEGNEAQNCQKRLYAKNTYPNDESSKLSARNRSKGIWTLERWNEEMNINNQFEKPWDPHVKHIENKHSAKTNRKVQFQSQNLQ